MILTQYFNPGSHGCLSGLCLEIYTKDQREISSTTFCSKWRGVSCPAFIREKIAIKLLIVVALLLYARAANSTYLSSARSCVHCTTEGDLKYVHTYIAKI